MDVIIKDVVVVVSGGLFFLVFSGKWPIAFGSLCGRTATSS